MWTYFIEKWPHKQKVVIFKGSNNCKSKSKNKKHLFEPIQVVIEFDLSSVSLWPKLTNTQTESVCGSASKAVLILN